MEEQDLSALFLVRVRITVGADGSPELRGMIKHAESDRVRYFNQWESLSDATHALWEEISPPAQKSEDSP